MSRRARVTFSYKPEQDDELTLEVGEIIMNIVDVDVGWCEGELNGKRGMFPNNFVEELVADAATAPSTEEVLAPPEPASSNTATEKKVKVTFDYEAQDEDELALHVGDVIDFICEVEEGWWRGKLKGKIGVFPSNFVETVEVKGATQTKDKPVEIPKEVAAPEKEAVGGEEKAGAAAAADDDDSGIEKRHPSVGKSSKHLFGGGMGFGNLINADILAEKRLKKVHHDEKKPEKKEKASEEKNIPTAASKSTAIGKPKAPLSAKSRPAPPVPSSPPIVQPAKKPTERAKVMFDYKPENPDELKLTVGDVVIVTNKDIPDNEGWWEGELNGKFGVFPTNFVELLPAVEEDLSAPTTVVPPPTQKKGVPVLPAKDEIKKSPKVHKKPSPKLAPKDESDSDAVPEPHPSARPEVKKPQAEPAPEATPHPAPAKPKPPGHKPVLPPKKPLPVQTKPKPVVKKPEETSSAAVKKGAEETKDHVDSKPAVKEIPNEADVSNPPSIKTDNVEEEAISFDDIPVTETLNHLTANRAKAPQKRPPSKEGRLTDSARLSGSMLDEQLPQVTKQPPGRPKEGPKEPAWKKEVREAREKKQNTEEKAPPAVLSKTDAIEKRKSWRDEAQAQPVQKVEPLTTSQAEVDKLRKEIAELREMISKVEKKHDETIKKLEEKFTTEIESLTFDFDEERKHNAALKVEIDRLKRRQSRQDS